MWNKLQIHSLPTDESMVLAGQLYKNGNDWGMCNTSSNRWSDFIPHHLYLTSDDEIKEGDWFIDFGVLTGELQPTIAQAKPSSDLTFLNHPTKRPLKIVATTNPDLWYKDLEFGGNPLVVPKIPQSLIQYFVEKQGNVKEVMVEYHEVFEVEKTSNTVKAINKPTTIKLTSSGEIIWKPVEEKMYTKSEVSLIALGFAVASFKTPEITFEEWFDKNYPE